MIFMVGMVALFIYSNFLLKDRITYRIVKEAEFTGDILTLSVFNILGAGHTDKNYEMIKNYGNLIGISDIGIYGARGKKSIEDLDFISDDNDKYYFLTALKSKRSTAYFGHNDTTYERFEPLIAEGPCLTCHAEEGELLGILKFAVSTKEDFSLLDNVRSFFWILGLIVTLPLGGILVVGAIIREKNKFLLQLNRTNTNLQETYNDLQETKSYLELILNNSKALIVTTDTRGRIVEFNKEAENLLEYTKNDIVGKDVLMLYEDPTSRPMVEQEKGVVWSTRNREVSFKSKSGKTVYIYLSLSTLVDDRDEIIGTVGIGKDISELKMLQFKILQSEKLAGIGTLASGIAHEINNPLAGILGMAEAIKDEDDLVLVKDYADDIIQYSVNAGTIVKELSAYSRTARSDSTTTTDMANVIENSLRMAMHSAPLISIKVVKKLDKDICIFANSGELQQVFVNLTVNAIHAMKEEGTLTLRCWKEGSFAMASVTDTGEGIAKGNLSQVFDPFFTTKPAGSGTGLGLYVVYRLVTKYGGTIDVNSVLGEGTIFTLKFHASDSQDIPEPII